MQIGKSLNRGIALAGIILTTGIMLGCNNDANVESGNEEAASAPQVVQRQAPEARSRQQPAQQDENNDLDFRVTPKLEGALEEDGMGLDVMINASDKQAYADSLQWIAQDASEEQVMKLESSIQYINMYDTSVFGNEAKLLELLDGKTGHEVIEHAEALTSERRRR